MEHNSAKDILISGSYTCVLVKEDNVVTSYERGVKPLVNLIRSGEDFSDFYAADKVIGKATAFLYVLLQVKSVYGSVISESALKVLTDNSICVEYETLVKNIINRRGDGICPFEDAVLSVEDADEALAVIINKMREMGIK